MTINPALATELALLTQALDLPTEDVAETLTRLASDARVAVESYLGLSVAITVTRSQVDLTALAQGVQPQDIRSSLLVPLSPAAVDGSTDVASLALILYAAAPGAFVDVAADLSWITGRALADFRIDEHRGLPAAYATPTQFAAMAHINQALGVLIGLGVTPEEAERDLYARAATADLDLLGAATLVLAGLGPAEPDSR